MGIGSDSPRMDPEWKNWEFHELLEALVSWIDNVHYKWKREIQEHSQDILGERKNSQQGSAKPMIMHLLP